MSTSAYNTLFMGGITPKVACVFGGRYKISDVVQGISGSRLVRLCDRYSGIPIAATWSNSITGAYSFTGVANRDYIVYAVDYNNFFNDAIADRPLLTSM